MMDERQELNAGKAALAVLGIIMLVCVGILAWEYIRTNNVTNTPAIVTMIGAGGLFVVFQRMFGAEAPRTVFGRELPTGPSPAERSERKRAYAVDAATFAVALVVFAVVGFFMGDAEALDTIAIPGLGSGTVALVAATAIGTVLGFGIFYGLNYLFGESASRSVERAIASRED